MTSIGITQLVPGLHNLRDYHGVDARAVADTSAALQSALDQIAAESGTVALLPGGSYNLASDVEVPATVTLVILDGVTLSGAGGFCATRGGAIVDYRSAVRVWGDVRASGLQGGVVGQANTVVAGEVGTLPANHQAVAYGTYAVNGEIAIDGELRVGDWPF